MRRAFVAAALALLAVGCASRPERHDENTVLRVEFAAPHLGARALPALLYAPNDTAAGPRPAVIMLHGCGGVGRDDQPNARHAMWRDWLLDRGFMVVFPLSFTARGLSEICTVRMGERTVQPRDRVADVLATVEALRARGDVDATRLVLWGFSHGGSTVLATVAREPRARGLFRQAIAFYPGCSAYAAAARRGERLALAAPLAILIGEADDWTPAAPCRDWIETLAARGEAAEIALYPGAYHDFDSPRGRPRLRTDVPNGVTPGRGVTVGPNPAAREAAKQRVATLLADRGLIDATAR